MNLIIYIRECQKSGYGYLCKGIYDGSKPITRTSLKLKVPLADWDGDNQVMIDRKKGQYKDINTRLNELKRKFNPYSSKAEILDEKLCFLEAANDILNNKIYVCVDTKKKYRTVLNSLKKYVKNVLQWETLPIKEFRKIGFIEGYKVFLRKVDRKGSKLKTNNSMSNYLSVLTFFVNKFLSLNQEVEQIKTKHYKDGIGKPLVKGNKAINEEEISLLYNLNTASFRFPNKAESAKNLFFFQFFTQGLRVSDVMLLRYSSFNNGKLVIYIQKSKKQHQIRPSFNSIRHLGYFYPNEYNTALSSHLLGEVEYSTKEMKILLSVSLVENNIETLNAIQIREVIKKIELEKKAKYSDLIAVLKKGMLIAEHKVCEHMCQLMQKKKDGFVFPFLKNEDFSNLASNSINELTEKQSSLLHRARVMYNGRLETIEKYLKISPITSHVTRHSFTYFMLKTGASIEEISLCLGHSSIKITQEYLRKFPSDFANDSLNRFNDLMGDL